MMLARIPGIVSELTTLPSAQGASTSTSAGQILAAHVGNDQLCAGIREQPGQAVADVTDALNGHADPGDRIAPEPLAHGGLDAQKDPERGPR